MGGTFTKGITLLLAVACAAAPAFAQGTGRPSSDEARVTPNAISGLASSGRHCLSSDAANVHYLGWLDAGTHYAVTFDADAGIVASIVRLDLAQGKLSYFVGQPDISSTAATAGAMVLLVASANGAAGCYQYKAEMNPPSLSTAASAAATASLESARLIQGQPAGANGTLAISGTASSAQHCVAGSYVPNAHEIGRIDQQSRITITFDADFDAIAGVTLTNPMDTSAGRYYYDDSSGGGVTPALSVTANAGENVVLYVASKGAAGCYRYQVQIR